MTQIKAILFDCDGTLLDTEHVSTAAVQGIWEKHGIRQDDENEFIGVHTSDILKTMNGRFGKDISMESYLEGYTDYMMKNIPIHMRILDGTRDYIRSLKDRGYKLTVGSNGTRQVVWEELKVGGLVEFFDTILTADDVARPKPAPDMYLDGMKAVGIDDPAACIVVEDSVTGIRAAVAAGMTAVGYLGLNPDPAALEPKLRNAGALHIVRHLQDIDLLLK